eukprot:303803-Pelagomonas_calceolata.AAC.6
MLCELTVAKMGLWRTTTIVVQAPAAPDLSQLNCLTNTLSRRGGTFPGFKREPHTHGFAYWSTGGRLEHYRGVNVGKTTPAPRPTLPYF